MLSIHIPQKNMNLNSMAFKLLSKIVNLPSANVQDSETKTYRRPAGCSLLCLLTCLTVPVFTYSSLACERVCRLSLSVVPSVINTVPLKTNQISEQDQVVYLVWPNLLQECVRACMCACMRACVLTCSLLPSTEHLECLEASWKLCHGFKVSSRKVDCGDVRVLVVQKNIS